jgi:hypothetical protein
VNTLTVTANNTTSGEAVSSAAQTITVTDPPLDQAIVRGADVLWPGLGGGSAGSFASFADAAAVSPVQLAADSGAVLWNSHDPAASTTSGSAGTGSLSPDLGTLGAGAGVVWDQASNSPSIGAILRGSGGQSPSAIGQLGFGAALSFADPSPSAGGVLWSAVDPAGTVGSTALPAQASGLHLSAPDAVGVGVPAGLVPLMSSSMPVNQHPMLGIG